MSLTALGWLFTLGVLIHNIEEAVHFPRWSATAGKWHAPVGEWEFRIAAGLFSCGVIAITAVASIDGASRVAAYLMAGYVLAMVLNAVVPHALLSIAMRRTMPGTATALLLNLPLGLWYLHRALLLGRIEERVFFWAGPAVVVLLLWSIRPLFALSRSFLGHRRRSQ